MIYRKFTDGNISLDRMVSGSWKALIYASDENIQKGGYYDK